MRLDTERGSYVCEDADQRVVDLDQSEVRDPLTTDRSNCRSSIKPPASARPSCWRHSRSGRCGWHGVSVCSVDGLSQRWSDGRPVFGLSPEFEGRRWVSRDGGPDDLALAHGEPRPDRAPLITVGVLRTRLDEHSWIDVHNTLGIILMLAEPSRNDRAFQHETRDQAAIDRELAAVPGPADWNPTTIELDGVSRPFQQLDRGGDWIAFWDLGNECVWVHAEQPNDASICIVTLADITVYLDASPD